MILPPALVGQAFSRAGVEASVPRWCSEIPLYRSNALYSDCAKNVGAAFWSSFEQLPTITKREIQRGFPHNFLRAGVELAALVDQDLVEVERTSGTSENPIPLLLGRGWWDQQERAALALNSFVAKMLKPGSRRVTIISPLCSSELSFKGIPSKLDRTLGQSLFINLTRHPFLWNDAELERMARETAEWEPLFLDVDPVYGALFALYCERQGIRFPSLRFIISSYEFLSVHHRRAMERVFKVPVFNLYGSTETGHLLMETESSKMVPSHSTAYLELIEVDDQGIGKLVVTTLTNEYMPLIRYQIGDLARATSERDQIHYEIQGRSRDKLPASSGEPITTAQIDSCTEFVKGIAHYQLRQVDNGEYVFYHVDCSPGIIPEHLETLRLKLSELLRTTKKVNMVATDFILPESSGKFRLSLPKEI